MALIHCSEDPYRARLVSLCLACFLILYPAIPAVAQTTPPQQTASIQQLTRDLQQFFSSLNARNVALKARVNPLLEKLNQRLANGENVSCSYQIYRELQWRLNFTSDSASIEKRIADLSKSLGSDEDQSFADDQSPEDGSWGPCYTVIFMKLYQTAEFVPHHEPSKYRATFLDQFNSPEKLKNYFDSIVTNDFYKSGEVNRVRVDDSMSALGRLILNGRPLNYSWDPRLKEAYRNYLDGWQNPTTGLWGLWFVARDGTIVKTPDVGMTFHILSQRDGQVNFLEKIPRSILALKSRPFPFGYMVNGHYENHMNGMSQRSFGSPGTNSTPILSWRSLPCLNGVSPSRSKRTAPSKPAISTARSETPCSTV